MCSRRIISSLVILATVLLGGSVFAESASNDEVQKITIRADIWMPYYGDPKAGETGYMIDVLAYIFGEHQVKLDFVVVPWSRAISLTKNGSSDCIIGAADGEAPSLLYGDFSLGMGAVGFYTRSDFDWQYEDEQSLKSMQIGVTSEYAYAADYLNGYIADPENERRIVKVHGANTLHKLVTLLKSNRIDAFVENIAVVDHWLSEQSPKARDELKFVGQVEAASPLFLACSPVNASRSQRILKLASLGMEKLRQSGDLERILNRYGMKDWKKLEAGALIPSPQPMND